MSGWKPKKKVPQKPGRSIIQTMLESINSSVEDMATQAGELALAVEGMTLTVSENGATVVTNTTVWSKREGFWWAWPENGMGGLTGNELAKKLDEWGQEWVVS